MAHLHIRLFGGFEVRRSAGPFIVFPTRKARALLARLARQPGQPTPREVLAAILWPESAEHEARGNLRQALKLVRRALADRGRAVIVSEGDALVLEPAAAEVDVARFEALHQAGAPEALEQAAALYRGDFLEGTTLADGPFAEWAMIERVRLRERALDVFSRLLARREAVGETEAAIDIAFKLLALDPLQEHVHRRLMQLYLEQGRRGSALEQYRICRTTLQRELDVRPEAETERLYREIRRCHTRVELPAPAPEPPAKPRAPPPSRVLDAFLQRPAVVVLPFANLSGDSAQTYFSDGLSEDIITALAGWRTFPLIASNSTFTCRGERHDVRAIARSLGAQYVIDGSVRRSGSRMRVTVRLIESEGGRHLWAERFDFHLHDILAVQEEVANKVAALVEPELERVECHRIVAKRTEDLTAWDYCLQGTELLRRRTREANARARSCFTQALKLDSEYSDAFTGLAFSYAWDLSTTAPDAREPLIARALEAGQQAVALDHESSTAHLALSTAYVWAEQIDVAMPETELAIELNPSNAFARLALGNRLDLMGRTAEGIAQIERSFQLNPRDPYRFRYMGFLSRAHLSAEHYEAALAWAYKAAQLRPDYPDVHFRLAVCLAHLDQPEEARAALNECERLQPGYLENRKGWQPYSDAARNAQFFAGLRRHDLFG